MLTSDGYDFRLDKMSHMEDSEVFGNMIEALGSDTIKVSVSEDDQPFQPAARCNVLQTGGDADHNGKY